MKDNYSLYIYCKHKSGGDGYLSHYLSLAKRALYHLSYTPLMQGASTHPCCRGGGGWVWGGGRLAQWKSARSAYGRSRVRTPQCTPCIFARFQDLKSGDALSDNFHGQIQKLAAQSESHKLSDGRNSPLLAGKIRIW